MKFIKCHGKLVIPESHITIFKYTIRKTLGVYQNNNELLNLVNWLLEAILSVTTSQSWELISCLGGGLNMKVNNNFGTENTIIMAQ